MKDAEVRAPLAVADLVANLEMELVLQTMSVHQKEGLLLDPVRQDLEFVVYSW